MCEPILKSGSFVPEDILSLEVPSYLSLFSGGALLCFQLDRPVEGGYCHSIVIMRTTDGVVLDSYLGTSPAVSPDGAHLAFFDPANVLTVVAFQDGSVTKFQEFLRASDLAWSPGGTKLLLSACVFHGERPAYFPQLQTVQWIDRMKFKTDGVGIWDGAYRQLFVLEPQTGCCQAVTTDKRDIASPFWLDDTQVGYVANLDSPDYSDLESLVFYHLTTKERRSLVGPGGPITHPAASPSGKQVAFLSHDNSFWEATNFHLYVATVADGALLDVSRTLDRSVGNYLLCDVGLNRGGGGLSWDREGERVFALLTDKSRCSLNSFSVKSGEMETVGGGVRAIFDYARAASGTALLYTDHQRPAVISFLAPDGSEKILWSKGLLEGRQLAIPAEFAFDGFDSTPRQGFYLPPAGPPKGVVLCIHGGPHFCYGENFSVDFQLLCSHGFGVVFCNPAGSQGAGEEISKASKMDWGGKDYQELMACVDRAIQLFQLEGLSWGVMGGSYGGFLTNWIIGHTDRFSCAIAERSTCNRYSQAGTSDCAFRYGEYEFQGLPWDHPQFYLDHSPISYVRQIHTPLLLIHGDEDMNCPISQSEEMYSALKLIHKEVYFARFPGECHSLTAKGKPQSRVDRARLFLWWFDRYL